MTVGRLVELYQPRQRWSLDLALGRIVTTGSDARRSRWTGPTGAVTAGLGQAPDCDESVAGVTAGEGVHFELAPTPWTARSRAAARSLR